VVSRVGVIAERGVETAGQRTSQGPAGSFVSSLNAGVGVGSMQICSVIGWQHTEQSST
jgi:hypothetical protein